MTRAFSNVSLRVTAFVGKRIARPTSIGVTALIMKFGV
jgi:hypothetical protein